MKKIVLVLAVLLLAVPALAEVSITIEDEGDGIVAIRYDARTQDPNVRAFALDIAVTAGTIETIYDFKVGESNSVDPGFGIFMGSIQINEEGEVVNFGDPVAPEDSPGSIGILGEPNLTIELGALYYDDVNAPDPCGLICRVTVTEDCNMCITENETRGGITMQDLSEISVVTLPCNIPIAVGCQCYGDITGSYMGADANNFAPDGDVDIYDLSVMANLLLPTSPSFIVSPTPEFYECADVTATSMDPCSVNGPDGDVDIYDLTVMANHLLPTSPLFNRGCIPNP